MADGAPLSGADFERRGGSGPADLPVIAAISRKGGCGKSTLVKAMVSAAISRGLRCLVIETDAAETLSLWVSRARDAGADMGLVEVHAVFDTASVGALLDAAYDEMTADIAFIDTAGIGQAATDEIAAQATAIVTPSMLTETDMETTRQTLDWYARLRARVSDPEALAAMHVVINNIRPKPIASERAVLLRMVESMPVIETGVHNRPAYADMDQAGPLGAIMAAKRDSDHPLERAHVGRFAEALEEADDLLSDVVGGVHARRAG